MLVLPGERFTLVHKDFVAVCVVESVRSRGELPAPPLEHPAPVGTEPSPHTNGSRGPEPNHGREPGPEPNHGREAPAVVIQQVLPRRTNE